MLINVRVSIHASAPSSATQDTSQLYFAPQVSVGVHLSTMQGSEATADDRPHEGIEFEGMKIVTTAINNSEPLSVSFGK